MLLDFQKFLELQGLKNKLCNHQKLYKAHILNIIIYSKGLREIKRDLKYKMDQELKTKILKTGTTILGIVCSNGIVMAADRRTTAGNMIMGKNIKKAVQINDYLVTSGSGNASDIEMQKKLIAAELKLKQLRSKKRPTIKESANLIASITYRSIRNPSMIPSIVGTLVAGFNEDGTVELYSIEPAGSVFQVEDYDANFGSGMPFVLGLLERQYKKDLTMEQGVELAIESLKSSTQRDIGSGNGIDVFTISKDGINHVVKQEILAEYKDRE